MGFNLAMKCVSLLRGGGEFSVEIHRHEFGAGAVAKHAHERIVAVEQPASRGSHKDTFLGLLENQAVLFFRCIPVGSVVHHVDGALLLASVLAIGRTGNHAIPAETRVLRFLNPFRCD